MRQSSIGVACWDYGDSRLDPFSEFYKLPRLGGGRDLIQFFFSGDRRESDPDQTQLLSLPDVYEAFALRHLPVSLETLQSTDRYKFLNFTS